MDTVHYIARRTLTHGLATMSVAKVARTSDALHRWANSQSVNYTLLKVDCKPPTFRSVAHESNWLISHMIRGEA